MHTELLYKPFDREVTCSIQSESCGGTTELMVHLKVGTWTCAGYPICDDELCMEGAADKIWESRRRHLVDAASRVVLIEWFTWKQWSQREVVDHLITADSSHHGPLDVMMTVREMYGLSPSDAQRVVFPRCTALRGSSSTEWGSPPASSVE